MAVRPPSTFAFGVTPTKKAGWAALKAHGVTAELQAHGLAKSNSLRDVAAAKLSQALGRQTPFPGAREEKDEEEEEEAKEDRSWAATLFDPSPWPPTPRPPEPPPPE